MSIYLNNKHVIFCQFLFFVFLIILYESNTDYYLLIFCNCVITSVSHVDTCVRYLIVNIYYYTIIIQLVVNCNIYFSDLVDIILL